MESYDSSVHRHERPRRCWRELFATILVLFLVPTLYSLYIDALCLLGSDKTPEPVDVSPGRHLEEPPPPHRPFERKPAFQT